MGADSRQAITAQISPTGDERLNLVEIWLIYRTYWRWFLAGIFAGAAVAVGYAALATAAYESRATIQVGKIAEKGMIEEIGTLAVRLIEQYGSQAASGAPHLKQAALAPVKGGAQATDMLRLVVSADSPEAARRFLTEILSDVQEQHEELYDSAMNPLQQRLAAVDKRIGIMTTQMLEVNNLIGRLKDSQPVQASLTAVERGRAYVELHALERERVNLQRQVVPPYTTHTRVVREPSMEQGSVIAKLMLYGLLGAFLGLVLAWLAILVTRLVARDRGMAGSEST